MGPTSNTTTNHLEQTGKFFNQSALSLSPLPINNDDSPLVGASGIDGSRRKHGHMNYSFIDLVNESGCQIGANQIVKPPNQTTLSNNSKQDKRSKSIP
jgi:hypothetical protein